MGEMIQFVCPDGSHAPGYLATPSSGKGPGLVVIQEWWGLNNQIKKTADRYAEQGFRALVPDLYRGKVAADPDEANHMMTGLDWGRATHQDLRGAVKYLKSNGAKAGVLGFCMGGALTILAGVHVPEVDALVCFYGIPPAEAADPAKIKAPLIGFFATQDDWCSPSAVKDLEQKLQSGGVNYELHNYNAQHAFFNESRPEVYDAAAATDSWNRSVAFLHANLG